MEETHGESADVGVEQAPDASGGPVSLDEYRLHLGGREWSILHTGAILSHADEQRFLGTKKERVPYGVVLWPAAIALAHEIIARAESFRGAHVLELGAGTGLPGIVAASLGAEVVQTDRQELALSICRRNGVRNGLARVEHRLADWTTWDDAGLYDWILGSDILYAAAMHPHLRRIFETNLAPGGRVLLADPFRAASLPLLTALELDGWAVSLSRWSVGEEASPRSIGLFELVPPATAAVSSCAC